MRQLASHGTVWIAATQLGLFELLVIAVILIILFVGARVLIGYLVEKNAQFEKDDGKTKIKYTWRTEPPNDHREKS